MAFRAIRFSRGATAARGIRAPVAGMASMAASSSMRTSWKTAGAVAGVAFSGLLTVAYAAPKVDYDAVRNDIVEALEAGEFYDDGSYGPVFVRLAWHASGTYCMFSNSGGSNGATMRFSPESRHGANAGLDVARDVLEKVKKKHPEISYADLWTLAGCVAIEEMGGPKITWRPGRTDAKSGASCPVDGRLPDAARGADHIRAIFHRMGMSDQEIVALVGAHALGRCHANRSGFDGPWTYSPTSFSNDFFKNLLEMKWQERKWDGPKQFENEKGQDLMMLPGDLALIEDPNFKKWVVAYAGDQDLFFRDFAAAFEKLISAGVPFGARV